ncbi:MAG: galactosyltransferase [Methanohalophilus sp. 2-GBenrich]|uniref:glycosyltransferase family 4 protein n=1 Tax=Methanohalophilus sp. 2-GBenrich TaxID=1884871 RepID=UPI00086C9622|nr:glycosyltransferase family 4 protein [Methanohalophilus sp. 2-GBenrich]ODV50001.1 MAG: galactosyltransferase [Methanohalophilus sp. 2-GBenrich]RXG34815.1 galactosyltransferase [Methanohalophilus sp. WG1-DM]
MVPILIGDFLKVAFVYDAIYPWVKGGAEKRIYEIGKRLAERGDEVHLFGVKWWEGENIIEYEGMTLHGVCAARELYINGKRSISEALIFSVKLFKPLLKEKFDVIDVSVFPYFSCFTVRTVSVLRKTPAFFTWHEVWDDYWYEYMGRRGFFGKIIERIVAKISSENIAVSEWTKKQLISIGTDPEKIQVVPNGINLQKITGIKPANKTCDIIFAGRLIKEKNIDVLLNAVARLKANLPQLKCCIIGDGPEKDRLLKLSQELEIADNVEFAGFLKYDALIARIKSSRVFVLPSSREGFGIIVIEAFACGVPVITVSEKRNAAQDLIDEGVNGFVVELDSDQIDSVLKKILLDDSFQKMCVENTVQKAGKYEWDIVYEKLILLYE